LKLAGPLRPALISLVIIFDLKNKLPKTEEVSFIVEILDKRFLKTKG
jgi:hypothetical protein